MSAIFNNPNPQINQPAIAAIPLINPLNVVRKLTCCERTALFAKAFFITILTFGIAYAYCPSVKHMWKEVRRGCKIVDVALSNMTQKLIGTPEPEAKAGGEMIQIDPERQNRPQKLDPHTRQPQQRRYYTAHINGETMTFGEGFRDKIFQGVRISSEMATSEQMGPMLEKQECLVPYMPVGSDVADLNASLIRNYDELTAFQYERGQVQHMMKTFPRNLFNAVRARLQSAIQENVPAETVKKEFSANYQGQTLTIIERVIDDAYARRNDLAVYFKEFDAQHTGSSISNLSGVYFIFDKEPRAFLGKEGKSAWESDQILVEELFEQCIAGSDKQKLSKEEAAQVVEKVLKQIDQQVQQQAHQRGVIQEAMRVVLTEAQSNAKLAAGVSKKVEQNVMSTLLGIKDLKRFGEPERVIQEDPVVADLTQQVLRRIEGAARIFGQDLESYLTIRVNFPQETRNYAHVLLDKWLNNPFRRGFAI